VEIEGIDVVTGWYVLTLADETGDDTDTLLEVNSLLDDGVDTLVLTYGLLVLTGAEELATDDVGCGTLVVGAGDGIDVVTGW